MLGVNRKRVKKRTGEYMEIESEIQIRIQGAF